MTSSDVCMTEEEFYEKIDCSIQQAKEGKVLRVSTNEDLKNLLGLWLNMNWSLPKKHGWYSEA